MQQAHTATRGSFLPSYGWNSRDEPEIFMAATASGCPKFSARETGTMIQLSSPLNLACPSLAGSCSSWWPLTPPHPQLQLQCPSSRSRESNATFFPHSEPSTHIQEPTARWPPTQEQQGCLSWPLLQLHFFYLYSSLFHLKGSPASFSPNNSPKKINWPHTSRF